ncbi:MAG: SPOCS domain-containing protein [Bacillota bacterium]
MPIQFEFTEPEQVLCMKIVTPVVLAETEAQVVIDKTLHLPELVKKVDHIDARVKDFEAEPVFIHEGIGQWQVVIPKEWSQHFKNVVGGVAVLKKVIVSGVLHKQIFYVNKDDVVKHVQEEVPFTRMIELKEPQPVLNEDEVVIRPLKPRIDVSWELIRGSRLQQTGVIIVRIKIVEERQIFVQLCPSPEVCPPGNLLEDPGLEQWVGNVPVFWGATANVAPTNIVHSGSRAAELGTPTATAEAAIFQTVRDPQAIGPGRTYRLTFWARENVTAAPVSNFSLNVDILFFNRFGQQVDGVSQSFASAAIPDNAYQQFTINTPAAPLGTATALVRFTFLPGANNTNTVKIDDVNFECTGGFIR